jgi:pimeloyl-ACP methyl ester carboxylesterase
MGWCAGSAVAIVTAAHRSDLVDGLLLETPSPVGSGSEKVDLLKTLARLGLLKPDLYDLPVVDNGIAPSLFTQSRRWISFIRRDKLKTRWLTPRCLVALSELDWERAIERVRVPILVARATRDRLVDEQTVLRFTKFTPAPKVLEFDSGHAIQFERADELASAMLDFAATCRSKRLRSRARSGEIAISRERASCP